MENKNPEICPGSFWLMMAIIALTICCYSYPTWYLIKTASQFHYGYEDGYNCFHDTYNSPDDFLIGKVRADEGFYDYWWGTFWFQQGYEEGYKKAAKEYWKEYIK